MLLNDVGMGEVSRGAVLTLSRQSEENCGK
jgi:hypothetical protein